MQTTKPLRIAGAIALALATQHPAVAGCSDPIAVGSLGGGESLAWDINDAGQVVGEALTPGGQVQAYIWSNGAMTGLGALDDASDSVAWGVNDLGQVVGTSDSTTGPRTAMLWDGGAAIDIGAAMGATGASVAWDINNAGQVVGQVAMVPGFSKAYRWEQGVGVVQHDGDSPYHGTAFLGVNEAGVAVGHQFIFLTPDTGMMSVPGRDPGTYTDPFDLPSFKGPFSFSWASAVNESGTIVGHANPGTGPWTGVIWTPGTQGLEITVIGTLPDLEYAEGEDINDHALAVGWSADAENTLDPRAWAWKDGILHDLNNFLLPDSQWEILLSARAVNNNGDIAGIGRLKTGQLQGFVMQGFTGVLPGDFNEDGSVNAADLVMLVHDLGECPGCPTDLNCDGLVNAQDVVLLMKP